MLKYTKTNICIVSPSSWELVVVGADEYVPSSLELVADEAYKIVLSSWELLVVVVESKWDVSNLVQVVDDGTLLKLAGIYDV